MDLPAKDPALEYAYPDLAQAGYKIIGQCTKGYDCLAFALDRPHQWKPIRDFTVENVTRLFNNIGYSVCDSADYEDGYDKVAIYESCFFRGKATHVARQRGGVWQSKLGSLYTIQHGDLQCLAGLRAYGIVAAILKRPTHLRRWPF